MAFLKRTLLCAVFSVFTICGALDNFLLPLHNDVITDDFMVTLRVGTDAEDVERLVERVGDIVGLELKVSELIPRRVTK